MYTDGGLKRYDYIRVCDICGVRWHFSKLKYIGQMRWACPDDAEGLTEIQISTFNAKARPLRIRPNRRAKGLAGTPVYQLDEAAVFNYIAGTAPAQTAGGSSSAAAAAWAGLYLADVLIDGRRPDIWLAQATVRMTANLSYLTASQYTTSATNPRYGAFPEATGDFDDPTVYRTSTVAIGGLALLRGYQATGNHAYLEAAKRCATFLRRTQSGDVQVSAWTVYPQGGGPYHVGGLAASLTDASGILSNQYLIADIFAAWFLKELIDEVGDLTFGDAAATAFFGANAAPLSTMLAELQAFAATGAKDSTQAGAEVTGLSTTAPRATYVAARHGQSDPGGWTAITSIDSDSVCLALRGLYEADSSSPLVAAMMTWLAAFTPNTANATPAQRESLTYFDLTGTYDPAVCPASSLKTSAPFTEAAGAYYSWSSLGLLSGILAAADRGAFRRSKDALAKPRRVSQTDLTAKFLGPLGLSGLSYQVFGLQPDVIRAAKAGLCYRELPGHYPQVNL